jgi:tetratricopeptide (TPR) repeat protein
MNYCGRCGSANGTSARFCRQCGAELSSQAAFSSPSAPLNVEFSAKAGAKESQKESKPARVEEKQATVNPQVATDGEKPAPDNLDQSDGPVEAGEPTRDPVAISKSLRRVRASGSLIIEASKKDQEQMNDIISQAIEGFEKKREDSAPPEGVKEQKPEEQIAGRQEIRPRAQAATAAAATTTTSGTSRRPTAPMTMQSSGTLSTVGHLPPNGPSSVLAQASGLNPKPSFGSKFRLGLIAFFVLLGIGTYFAFRDKILTQNQGADAERNLERVEDQSAQYVLLGERDREQGHYDEALSNFQRAISLTPNNPNVHFLVAQTYYNAGQIDEALKAYKAVLRIAPEHLEARLQVAQIHRIRGNWNAAHQEFQRIIALDQNSGQAAVALEAIEDHEAGSSESSAATIAKSRRPRTVSPKGPILPPATTAKAQISLLPQKLVVAPTTRAPEALGSIKPEENPDPQALADSRKKLGLRYLNVREYRAAINEFLAALRMTPDDKDIYYFLGSSYYGLGQYALAHDYYKRVDRGQYVQVAQSGAQRTEKAAREEYKRRMDMLKNEAQNEVKNEARKDPQSSIGTGKTF